MAKSTNLRERIYSIDAQLQQISTMLTVPVEFDDGTDISYLSGKFTQMLNTAKHIEGQIKFIKKNANRK